MTVLVLGARGQVGSHLRMLLPAATCWDRDDVDLRNTALLMAQIRSLSPSLIVNAAAYTAVDRAESEPADAWAVNADAPAVLAQVAAMLDIPLLHISTDYVFDGEQTRPYRETDPVCPVSVYGRTKLGGDLAVASIWSKHWILRTSWVFSEFGANFVKTILRLASERDELRIVADQHGQPTYAGDLARSIVAVIDGDALGETLPYGLYHLCGGSTTSWHGFATEILACAQRLQLIDTMPEVEPITTEEYPTPAARPRCSAMRQNETLAEYTRVVPDWRAGLNSTLESIRSARQADSSQGENENVGRRGLRRAAGGNDGS